MFAKQTRNKLAEFKKQFFKKRSREAPTGKQGFRPQQKTKTPHESEAFFMLCIFNLAHQ
jgi:hypothetical protein